MTIIKKLDIWTLYNSLEQIKTTGSPKFKYNILRNLKIIANQIDPLKEIKALIDEIIVPFLQAKDEIVKELGSPDKNGNMFVSYSDKEFIRRLDIETEKFDKEITDYKAKLEEFNVILDEKIDFEIPEFYKVSVDDLAENVDYKIIEVLDKFGILNE